MSYLGYHLQTPVNGWIAAVARSQPKVIKVFQIEMGNAVKAVSPGTIVVFRHHVSHQQPFLDKAGEGAEQAREAAVEFINQFEDSLNRQGGIDYVESLNETYATAAPETMRKAVAFDVGFVQTLSVICPAVTPIVFTAAIGNPGHDEYGPLVELARMCERVDGAFGYHAYWPVVDGESFLHSTTHQLDLHLRWVEIDEFLINHGHTVDWFLGEVGPIGANGAGYNLRANDGWKHPGVWADNRFACLEDLAAFDRLLAGTRAAQENRLIGAALFTSGEWDWEHFQYQQPMLDDVADYVAANPSPMPDPVPDPVPDSPRIVDITDSLAKHPIRTYATRLLHGITDHVIHHTATRSTCSAEQVASYHVNSLGWPGIGYTFYIAVDGAIYQTSRLETMSYATASQNHRYLSTAMAGNFCLYAPSQAQLDSLHWLHNVHLPTVLGRSLPMIGHKEGIGQATLCPGDKWDWHKLDESVEPEPEPEPGPPPPDDEVIMRVIVDKLNIRFSPSVIERPPIGQLYRGCCISVDATIEPAGLGDDIWACFGDGILWAAARFDGVMLMEVVE